MFKKALAHKSNATPIRSSARRLLVNSILEQYPSIRPRNVSKAEDGDEKDEPESGDKELGKLIVPEGVRTGTFETSAGIEGTFYFGPNGDPLWLTLGRTSKEYIPTLSVLALPLPGYPLPLLQIYYPLPPPLLTGAPLFLPAVRNLNTPWLIPDVEEGGVVAFVVSDNNGREVRYAGAGRVVASGGVRGAVERRARNIQQGKEVDEGKFCEILYIIDDHLWEMSSKPALSTFTLPVPGKPLVPPPASEQAEAGPSRSRPTSPTAEATAAVNDLDLSTPSASTPTAKSALSSGDISTLLSQALYQTLTTESLDLPMPASLLYSAHVLPNRPAYIPVEQRDDVVIGKSEWKKLTKWMKETSKDGLIKIKESKGETIIQSFDSKHVLLETHEPFLTVAKEAKKAAKSAEKASGAVNGDTNGSAGVQSKGKSIEELWRPSGSTVAFWDAVGVDKNELHSASQLKVLLDQYISKHGLVNPKDRRLVATDATLGKAIGAKQPGEGLSREEILRRLRAGAAWSVSIDGVVKKGALQPITMSVKTRQGRKTVTLVSGLETFGVDVDDFAEELKKLCAGSATVQPLQGASPKLNLREIMVQGSQVKVVTEALVAKGVPKRYIKEGEGDKKKKK